MSYKSLYAEFAVYFTLSLARMKHLISIATLFFLAFAGTSPANAQPFRWKSFPALNQSECLAQGGDWGVIGMRGAPYPPTCNLHTKDAEKVCSNPEDCEGYCIYDSVSSSATHKIGRCSTEQKQIGCRYYVQDNTVVSICSD